MTTDWPLSRSFGARVAGLLRLAVLVWFVSCPTATAQSPPVQHWLHAGALPPGAIGNLRQRTAGPLSGFFQPVRIRVPDGTRIALVGDASSDPQPGNLLVGLQVGHVYRLRVTHALSYSEVELFPTIELIDRLHAPPGLELRFPIPIELTHDELRMAADGLFVTRVIYVEDPESALPVEQEAGGPQPWVEAPLGEDPLVLADQLGRPVAILRIGNRVPREGDQSFHYGAPPVIHYQGNRQTQKPRSLIRMF